MQLKWLENFLALAQTRSFSRATEKTADANRGPDQRTFSDHT